LKSPQANMSTHARNNTTNKFKLPEMVNPDMENGLESVSCELAHKFYEHHSKELHRMKDREEIRRFYVSTVGKWASSRDGPGARHFNQVLFSLCRDGNVCRLTNQGKVVLWKANIPREKLVERCDRLADENRRLKQELNALKSRVMPMTSVLTPPESPVQCFERPVLKRQMTCVYDDQMSSPLHMASEREYGEEDDFSDVSISASV